MPQKSSRPLIRRGLNISPEAISAEHRALEWLASTYRDGEFPPLGTVPRRYRRAERKAMELQRTLRNFNATGFETHV